ncbi:26S proteasome subunit RPN7-domain-containing protein [Pisolithus croceorrhizus]|nr:26S proteasome subunit RPN7-domain-containing protein [Pisolithus croceorrhizus]KAI6161792.1 26S proteasome subunit RPN7-domain-containing protein [Pisolithus thermaeus]
MATMEVDAEQQQHRRRPVFTIDDDHPFDLDACIAPYTGRTIIDRLVAIIIQCPSIAPHALSLAFQRLYRLRDPSLLNTVISAYESVLGTQEGKGLPPVANVVSVDMEWVEDVTKRNIAERTKLEVELKTYTNNMIKESIRMAHRDLGDFFRSTGEFGLALKHYTKSREFCSTSQHVLDMCMSVLELAVEQRNYAHIPSYVYKAEGALESLTIGSAVAGVAAPSSAGTSQVVPQSSAMAIGTGFSSAAGGGGIGASVTGSVGSGSGQAIQGRKPTDRDHMQTKLEFVLALSHLGTGAYDKAAIAFLRLGPPEQLGDWIGKLVAPSDIAIYGTLCALASLPRSFVKAQLVDNPTFATYIEQEPYVRELVQSYMASNFKTVLDILSRHSIRHNTDIHLSPHIPELTKLIRHVSLVLYFAPFETVRLERMAEALGWGIEEVEREVVGLIQNGRIVGRVDSRGKILVAKKTDHRAELFSHAMKMASEMEKTNRKLLLRMRLQQADLVVKDPKMARREQDRGLETALGDNLV